MATGKNSKKFIVTVDQDKIEPDMARETVINFDPLNRAGKEGGFYLDENEELHIDDEDVMEAHKMAINKYPYDNAIKMIQLPFEEGEKRSTSLAKTCSAFMVCPFQKKVK